MFITVLTFIFDSISYVIAGSFVFGSLCFIGYLVWKDTQIVFEGIKKIVRKKQRD